MSRIHTRICLPILCVGLLFGCRKPPGSPRYDGIVKSHADNYPSGTGAEFDLVRGSTADNLYRIGREYGDPAKSNWTSTIQWKLRGYEGEDDVYEFRWSFSLSDAPAVLNTRKVKYDGTNSVIVFQNEWQTISIEPGSMPLPENSQPSVPGDA